MTTRLMLNQKSVLAVEVRKQSVVIKSSCASSALTNRNPEHHKSGIEM